MAVGVSETIAPYWSAVLLFRRFVMLLLAAFIVDPYVRVLVLLIACVLALVLHLVIQPFRVRFWQNTETCALALCVVIAVIQARLATFYVAGIDPRGMKDPHPRPPCPRGRAIVPHSPAFVTCGLPRG